jgi:hypothetical protein
MTFMMVDMYEHAGMKDLAANLREQSPFLSPNIPDDSKQRQLTTGKFDVVTELAKLRQKPSESDSAFELPV